MNRPGELVPLADGSWGTCDYEGSDEACGNCGCSWICHFEHPDQIPADPSARMNRLRVVRHEELAEGECSGCNCTRFTHTGRAE